MSAASLKVFIGFDAREVPAYQVTEHSLRKHASIPLEVQPLVLEHLRWKRLYGRPHEIREGRLWDCISDAPMATEFALTRFLVPHLAGYRGWAIFCDCDFLFRRDIAEVLELADARFAVMVCKHDHQPREALKMDGQIQTSYARKNWSSFMLVNCGHDMHAGTLDRVNRWRGLWLHQFRFLQDEDIGELPAQWNYLEGEAYAPELEPAALHFTRGTPNMPGWSHVSWAEEWRRALEEATGRPVGGIAEMVGAGG